MSLKAELETWDAALKAYDADDYEEALNIFSSISETSKIYLNCGMIYSTLGDHEAAVQQFLLAQKADRYLAIAYFQCGVSNFLLGQYDLALKDFEESHLYLRGNDAIYYEQLGLNFKLYSCEVLFNRGLTQIYMGQLQEGMADLEQARREKQNAEHDVIDDALRDRGSGYTVFSMPVGVLFRPSAQKMKNIKAKDYLGSAKLISSADAFDTTTDFSGVVFARKNITPQRTWLDPDMPLERPTPTLTRSRSAQAGVPTPSAVPGASLARSRSAQAVPSASSPAKERPAVGTSLARGSSMRNPITVGPARGASMRRLGPMPTIPPPPPVEKDPLSRFSDSTHPPMNDREEFYGDYLDGYNDEAPRRAAPLPLQPRAPPPPPPTNYAPSMAGGTLRRRPSRSAYGGGSEYDFEGQLFELVKIRVKMHYREDLRGMTLAPETPLVEFLERVAAKFGREQEGVRLKFADEDGGRVSLEDKSDWEMAIETAREFAKGRPEGKLEIWVRDV